MLQTYSGFVSRTILLNDTFMNETMRHEHSKEKKLENA